MDLKRCQRRESRRIAGPMTSHMVILVHQAEKLFSGLSTGAEQDKSGTDH